MGFYFFQNCAINITSLDQYIYIAIFPAAFLVLAIFLQSILRCAMLSHLILLIYKGCFETQTVDFIPNMQNQLFVKVTWLYSKINLHPLKSTRNMDRIGNQHHCSSFKHSNYVTLKSLGHFPQNCWVVSLKVCNNRYKKYLYQITHCDRFQSHTEGGKHTSWPCIISVKKKRPLLTCLS